jgi:hypothetical protein
MKRILYANRVGDRQIEISVDDKRLYIIKSVLDIAEEPEVEDVASIEMNVPELTPELCGIMLERIAELSFPLKEQFEFYDSLKDDDLEMFKEICKKEKCPCPLYWTVGCYQLCTIEDVTKLLDAKIVKFLVNEYAKVKGFKGAMDALTDKIQHYVSVIKGTIV